MGLWLSGRQKLSGPRSSTSQGLLPLRGSPSHRLKRRVVRVKANLCQQPHCFLFAENAGVIAWQVGPARGCSFRNTCFWGDNLSPQRSTVGHQLLIVCCIWLRRPRLRKVSDLGVALFTNLPDSCTTGSTSFRENSRIDSLHGNFAGNYPWQE